MIEIRWDFSRGDEISYLRELLAGDDFYTSKEIRPAHNLRKMLLAGSFNFKAKS